MADFDNQSEPTDRLKTINFLAHKAKTEGLTEEEKAEREVLRKEYLAEFRANMRGQLENIVFVDENGNQTPVRRKK